LLAGESPSFFALLPPHICAGWGVELKLAAVLAHKSSNGRGSRVIRWPTNVQRIATEW
jgi:hypothetical protein